MYNVKINRPFDRTVNNLVDDFFTGLPGLIKNDLGMTNGFFGNAPVNIKEHDDAFSIEIAAPGFEKPDFKINLDKDILTVSAEKKIEEPKKESKIIKRQFETASFKRSFTLTEKVDATNISASYVNGILVLNLPKKEAVKEPAKEIVIS
jgi:HSP20 family protein